MRITLPVSPYVATIDGVDNVVLSLFGLADPKFLRFPGRPTEALGDEFTFQSHQVDAQTLVDLGMSGAITFSTNMKTKTTYFLSSLMSQQRLQNTDADSVIVDATFAVGLRIGVFATNVDAKASLSIATVASKAELNQASTAYQVTVLGAGLEALETVRPLIANSTGPFTAETLQTIGAIQGSFDMLLADEHADLTPVITDVTIETDRVMQRLSGGSPPHPTLEVFEKASIFALERARRSKTADSAAQDAPARRVDAAVVRETYRNVLQLQGNQAVPADKRDLADKILQAGRF
jgi:hypothetical protein